MGTEILALFFVMSMANRLSYWGDMTGKSQTTILIQQVIFCAGDLRDADQLAIHSLIESNVSSLAKALDYIKKTQPKKFIFVSSCAVYGECPGQNEEADLSPKTLNGWSKLFCEKLISQTLRNIQTETTIIRLFNLFGGSDKFSIVARLQNCYRNDELFHLVNKGEALRDFIHVSDAAKIIKRIDFQAKLPKILNLGSGTPVTVKAILEAFEVKYGPLTLSHQNKNEIFQSYSSNETLEKLINYDFIDVLTFIKQL